MKNILEKNKLDGLLVTNLVNLKYLSRFSGSSAFLIFLPKKKYLVTDLRYLIPGSNSIPGSEGFEALNIAEEKWKAVLKNCKTIGIEADSLTLEKFKNFKKIIPNKSWKQLNGICKEQRILKTKEEIGKMKKAAEIAEKAFEKSLEKIKEGISEKEVAWEFEKNAKELGAEKLSFDTIVAFGKNSALPHHQTGELKLKKGDLILIDFGVVYKGYNSDCTRTFLTERNSKQEKIYKLVLEAQLAATKAAKIGKTTGEIFKVANQVFEKHGVEKNFLHTLGHGVGLEVHEGPTVYEKDKTELKEGLVFTIEPGLYLNGEFGVRIEDTVFVTKNGVESFQKFPKELQILEI